MATLVYSDADGVDRSFALGADPVMVGRSAECAIRSEDPRVSRVHARFFVDQGALWVEDLGSSNGIYVGANRVSRAPVPTGEIILVGSLMIRLLPASGTLPPPVGLHGTLASWLDMERKARAAVEEERNAFARRVGELHQELARQAHHDGVPSAGDTNPDGNAGAGRHAAEAVRMRDEAEARAAALERALEAVQDELLMLREAGGSGDPDFNRLRGELATARERVVALEREAADRADWSSNLDAESSKIVRELAKVRGELDESQAARSVAEHAAGEAQRESQELRQELDSLRRRSAEGFEALQHDLAKTREAQVFAETTAGVVVAERLAEADQVIAGLKKQLAEAKTARPTPDPAIDRERAEQITTLTARAEKAEKDLAASQIRAQGAERNLSGANSQAAKAETRASQLDQKLAEHDAKAKANDEELARARERIAALETRLGAGDAPVQAAEARAAKLAAELAEMTSQFETRRDRIAELEKSVESAGEAAKDAEQKLAAARAEVTGAAAKLAEVDQRATALQKKLADLNQAESQIAAAAKSKEEAAAKAAAADKRVVDAERRAEDAEKRASAADTMAKAMAKDVAEALRRAADSDTKSRSIGREISDLVRRAEQAELRLAQNVGAIGEQEQRAIAAEARIAELEKEHAGKVTATQKELGGKLEAREKELTAKLEAAQRELAAERSTAMGMVDRKTQLERELAETRAQLPGALARAEAAEAKVAEHEVQIETLQDRVDDLESGNAVAETAHQASLAEAREEIAALETRLADAKAAAGKGGEVVEQMRARVVELEGQLAETEALRDKAEAALAEARGEIDVLVSAATDSVKLEEAVSRAEDAERRSDALAARAEQADLAIGRAGALQRQLDEALTKLAWLERDSRSTEAADERITAADGRWREAEDRARDAESKIADAERRAQLAVQTGQHEAEQLVEQLNELQRRVEELEPRTKDAERRARDAEARLAEGSSGGTGQLAALKARIVELELENEKAENVRSFAAETEREIAQLQRELRDTRSKLSQMTLERDRIASELRDLREDSDTTSRRAPLDRGRNAPQFDPEATAALDVRRYEAMIAKTAELEQKVQRMERDDVEMRKLLADTENRLRAAMDREEDEIDSTHTGSQAPLALAEHVSVLEESIDSLRANMRAASDETAMMEQSDSVVAVASAVSSAAEHIERARAAVRALASAIGMQS